MNGPALVVGMRAEARIARATGWPVGIGGGDAAGALAAAEALAAAGATGLVSLGLAGGLAPDLPAGSAIVPSAVRYRGQLLPVDQRLAARLGGADGTCLLGVDAVVAATGEKQRLWRATGAAAADMESGPVAAVAQATGLPFAALRVVCDPADRDLPPAALVALDQSGAVGLGRVIGSLLRHPLQLPALWRLAADAASARRVLAERAGMIR
jgi:adenosylhomocysteine nucleosidase